MILMLQRLYNLFKNIVYKRNSKLNLEANHATLAGHTFEHEIEVARINNALGS